MTVRANVVPIWLQRLRQKKDGAPVKCAENVKLVMVHHDRWRGVLAYDAFSTTIIKRRVAPTTADIRPADDGPGEWTDDDTARTILWFAEEVGFEPSRNMVDDVVSVIAKTNIVHPVRDWLDALRWDGKERVDQLLPYYFGTFDSRYARAIGQRWMVSAVARVFEPGCQADCMLVLESERQGVGKSTGLEALAGKEWFADSIMTPGDKDGYQGLRGKWIYEFGELDNFKGRESSRIKNYVGAREDTYRPSYARRTQTFPRQIVFCGTTNDQQYLPDRTGNRRFWPVRVVHAIDVALIHRDREQLWAEAVKLYKSGHPWHVDTPELRELCEQEQEERVHGEPWLEMIREWLKSPKMPVVGSMSGEREPVETAHGITVSQVLMGALRFDPSKINHGAEIRVGKCMHELGWLRKRIRADGERMWKYFAPEHDDDIERTAIQGEMG